MKHDDGARLEEVVMGAGASFSSRFEDVVLGAGAGVEAGVGSEQTCWQHLFLCFQNIFAGQCVWFQEAMKGALNTICRSMMLDDTSDRRCHDTCQ